MSPCPTQPCQLLKGTSYSINVTFASSKRRFPSGGAGGVGAIAPASHCSERSGEGGWGGVCLGGQRGPGRESVA